MLYHIFIAGCSCEDFNDKILLLRMHYLQCVVTPNQCFSNFPLDPDALPHDYQAHYYVK